MKKTILLFSALLIFGNLSAQDKAALVNPIIGTNGMGHTFPGACVPFGLVQLSPDTDTIPHNVDGKYQPRAYEYCAGYQHKDSSIVGFSHTHFSGTGHSDLGVLRGLHPQLKNPSQWRTLHCFCQIFHRPTGHRAYPALRQNRHTCLLFLPAVQGK